MLSLACRLSTAPAAPPTPTPPTVASVPPTESPSAPVLPAPSGREGEGEGYISFIVNVHDWTHPTESADTLLKLVDLFEKYGVRGDFYFTAEITRELAEKHPDVIERFRNSNMSISYHVRPPHPLYTGFDS
ncbi:MAG: hypothetical protein N2049_07835 [Anaerolineales bacterium]|nr:hypothetical protein [Anaerolineales bacterium]